MSKHKVIVNYIKSNNNLNKDNKYLTLINNTNSTIPLNIFQTWDTDKLPINMYNNVELVKKQNPEFNYYLYTDEMRRDFIKNNFSVNILDTYNKLKPGAYKADLWRLCILYIFGGIYLDIKYSCVGNFKLISLTNKNYLVRDKYAYNQYGIYNALICSGPNNPLLIDFIDKIVENVKNNFYGSNSLEITGPLCLNKFFTQEDIKNLELSFDGNFILYNKTPILKMYKEYRLEQKKFGTRHYGLLWNDRNIYIMDNCIEIPLNIFQTWNTDKLPINMYNNIELLKKQNPEFNYYLYTDEMCRDFIKNNFSVNILDTYNKLKPGAYKADLWRLCILYIFGGIYLDIKYSCISNFKLISLTNKNYFVSDRNVNNEYGIYNALICSVPNNPLLLDCINKIVENVKNNFYGTNPLEVTGPLCLNKFFTQEDIKNLELSFDGNFILHNKTPILKMYKEYRVEQKKFGNAHYDYLWTKKNIYNI